MIYSIEDIKKSYQQGANEIPVLANLNLHVNEGESIAIVGRSGSGKSTLLSILSAIEDVDVGQVMLKGKALGDLNEDDKVSLRSSSIGVIFQQFHLLSHYTALENVMLPLEIQGGAVDKRLAASLLAKVGLSHREDHYPHQLSGGEKQRVAIARALILNPDVILADEPTGSLDIHTGEEVMDLIFNLVKENRVALVLVTHSMELANRCDKVFRLVEGHLVQE